MTVMSNGRPGLQDAWTARCEELIARRPGWTTASLTPTEARFLFSATIDGAGSRLVEIGTGSGYGTAIVATAAHVAHRSGAMSADYQVVTYEAAHEYPPDSSHGVGDAALELLEPDALAHVDFRRYTSMGELRSHFETDEVVFLFLNGLREHPWPVLDLLGALDALAPGARVVVRGVGPPSGDGAEPLGAKYLFDGVGADKTVDAATVPPTIGRIRLPEEKDAFRGELLHILYAHAWEDDVPTSITTAALS